MKIVDKGIVKVDNKFIVHRYDNGFVVEVDGRNEEDDWVNVKIIVAHQEEVNDLFDEYNSLPRDE